MSQSHNVKILQTVMSQWPNLGTDLDLQNSIGMHKEKCYPHLEYHLIRSSNFTYARGQAHSMRVQVDFT